MMAPVHMLSVASSHLPVLLVSPVSCLPNYLLITKLIELIFSSFCETNPVLPTGSLIRKLNFVGNYTDCTICYLSTHAQFNTLQAGKHTSWPSLTTAASHHEYYEINLAVSTPQADDRAGNTAASSLHASSCFLSSHTIALHYLVLRNPGRCFLPLSRPRLTTTFTASLPLFPPLPHGFLFLPLTHDPRSAAVLAPLPLSLSHPASLSSSSNHHYLRLYYQRNGPISKISV